jgi:4-amino-4-deoxy-L-arabinose transferase-like glycosyltransferase
MVIAGSVAVGMYIGAGSPDYFRDYRLNPSPDAQHYVLLGRNYWVRGEYSRMTGPPFSPDVMRTPMYPLVAGGLDLLGGPVAIYAFQATSRLVLVLGLYVLTCSVFGRRAAMLAASILAMDLALVVLDFEALSESLFNTLASLAVFWVVADLQRSASRNVPPWSVAGAGLLLGLAILTRPTALYLPLVFGLVWGWLALLRGHGRFLLLGGLFLASSYLLVAPWIARNYLVFGIPRLTTADPINLVYFAGAGAYAVQHGTSLPEAQEMIQKEERLASLAECNNFWKADRGVAQIDAELRQAAPRVLGRYPAALARSTITGIGKALFGHNTPTLAVMAGGQWSAPGMGDALRGDLGGFLSRLGQNSPFLVAVFFWELVFAFLLVPLGLLGVCAGLRRPSTRVATVCLLLVTAYYLLTVAVVGLDAYMRHRSMLIPLLAVFAALTFGLVRRKATQPETPA